MSESDDLNECMKCSLKELCESLKEPDVEEKKPIEKKKRGRKSKNVKR
jgi:hypothetical protein